MWPMLTRRSLLSSAASAGYHKATTGAPPAAVAVTTTAKTTPAAAEKAGGASKPVKKPRTGVVHRQTKRPKYAQSVQKILDRVHRYGLKSISIEERAVHALSNVASGLVNALGESMTDLLRETKKGVTFNEGAAMAATKLTFGEDLAEDLVREGTDAVTRYVSGKAHGKKRWQSYTGLELSLARVRKQLKGSSKQRLSPSAVVFVAAVVDSVVHDLLELAIRYIAKMYNAGHVQGKSRVTTNFIVSGVRLYDFEGGLGAFLAEKGATMRGSRLLLQDPDFKKAAAAYLAKKKKKHHRR